MEDILSKSFEYAVDIEKLLHISSHNSLASGNFSPSGDSSLEKPAPVNKLIPLFKFSKKYIYYQYSSTNTSPYFL